MIKTIEFRDESLAGDILRTIELQVEQETMTVAQLIEARVRAEVAAYNERASAVFYGLVQPSDAETALNGGFKMRPDRRFIDPEKQVFVALDAFLKNGFLTLIDNRQAERLDEEFLIDRMAVVSFVRLMPLVGG